MSHPVEPKITKITTQTYTSFDVFLLSMELNVSATFQVKLYNSVGEFLELKIMKLEGIAYQNWTSDDFVYQWVNNTLHEN
jgi:hypothetical protein